MTLAATLSRIFGSTPEEPAVAVEPAAENLRKDSLRCLGCNSWNRSRLVYMSNGGDYCLGCARHIAHRYWYTVAGKRWTDITSLD